MPMVTVTLMEGYDEEARARLGRAMTDAVRSVVPAAPEAVIVVLQEIPAANYMRGGERRTPAPPLPDPAGIARAFLDAMQERDLERARSFLAPGFEMTFPGDARMTQLEELVAFSASRYRSVRKTYERFDAVPGGDRAIVYCFGTLSGEWTDGTPFEGIRFVDRFEIEKGAIVRQQVWNDIAEVRNKGQAQS
ncbi:MAG: tautomerase family protein [Microvirga sp.]|nr:tautomerase family protein [Microvirga sp.]